MLARKVSLHRRNNFQKPQKMKEAMKEAEEVDADYVFKFMDEFICKPLKRGFEDMFQCQSNLQEMQLWDQK